jgi:hypothetical protein
VLKLSGPLKTVRSRAGHGDVKISLIGEAGFPLSSRPHVPLWGWN